MPKNDKLFVLIKSMTKSEKRYFRLFADWHGRKRSSKYLALFDALDAQDVYDEEAMRHSLGSALETQHLAELKLYLYNSILKALYLFNLEDSVESRVSMLTRQGEILRRKKLHNQAEQLFAKATRLAMQNDQPYFAFDIYAQRYLQLVLEQNNPDFAEKFERFFDELHHYNAINSNILDYWHLNARMYVAMNKVGQPRSEEDLAHYAAIMNHELMRNPDLALSPIAKRNYYLNHATYNRSINRPAKALEYYREILAMQMGSKRTSNRLSSGIATNLYNICLTCIDARDPDAFARYHRMLLQECEQDPASASYRLRINALSLVPNISISSGDFAAASEGIAQLEEAIRRYKGRMAIGFEVYTHFMGFVTQFGLEHYDRAIDYLNRILDNRRAEAEQKSMYYAARLLLVVTHYELQNFDLLDYLLKSTYKFLSSRGSVFKFELLVTGFFRSILADSDTQRLQKELIKLREALRELHQDHFERPVFEGFDYEAWVTSKLENRSFADVLRQQFNERRQTAAAQA